MTHWCQIQRNKFGLNTIKLWNDVIKSWSPIIFNVIFGFGVAELPQAQVFIILSLIQRKMAIKIALYCYIGNVWNTQIKRKTRERVINSCHAVVKTLSFLFPRMDWCQLFPFSYEKIYKCLCIFQSFSSAAWCC